MAFKKFIIKNRTLTIYKRKTSRSLKLSVGPNGELSLSMPKWASYQAGLAFVSAKEAWISANTKPPSLLSHGQAIGKAHHLLFEARSDIAKATSRIRATEVVISYPSVQAAYHPVVQSVATRAAKRALRAQAEQLLPARLQYLSNKHGLNFKSATIRQLKRRWGSCDQRGQIVLNYYLLQLPWSLIDYVLLHELTHTKVFKHGPEFWQAMERVLPNVKTLRSELRAFNPALAS